MEDNMRLRNIWICIKVEQNEDPTVVFVEKSSKLFSCDDYKEQVGDHMDANK